MKREVASSKYGIYFECDTAEDYLNELLPTGPLGGHEPFKGHLFRGVSKLSFDLVPSALRDFERLELLSGMNFCRENGSSRDWEDVFQSEYVIASEFFDSLDACGLAIPGDCDALRRYLGEYAEPGLLNEEIATGKTTWPPIELLPLLGLAQHFGLPTRLLDWSRNPLVAAYFSAYGAAEREYWNLEHGSEEGNSKIGVWYVSPASLGMAEWLTGNEPDLRVITAPASMNPNLRAQSGVFTVTRYPPGYNESLLDSRPINEVFQGNTIMFNRICLPSSEARRVLFLLAKHNISARTLFPGIGGAAKYVIERPYWGNPLAKGVR